MSEFMIMLSRDWNQDAERQPVTECTFVEYEDIDDAGFVGHISLMVQLDTGMYVEKRHRLSPGQFKFFVETIAARYHAGGPK